MGEEMNKIKQQNQQELNFLKAQLDNATSEVYELRGRVDEASVLTNDYSQVQAEFYNMKQQFGDIKNENTMLQENSEQQHHKIQELSQNNEQMKVELCDVTSKLQDITQEKEHVQIKYQNVQAELIDVSGKLQDAIESKRIF